MAFIYEAASYESSLSRFAFYLLTEPGLHSGVLPVGNGVGGHHPLAQGGQVNPSVAVMQAGTTLQLASRAM